MLKPNEYRESYIVSKDMPYRNKGAYQRGPQSMAGYLLKGRVVYVSGDVQNTGQDREIVAYADGIGVLLVNSRWLKRMH